MKFRSRIVVALFVGVDLAACAGIESGQYILEGHTQVVLAVDIDSAIKAAKQKSVADHRQVMPVFKIRVVNAGEIYVYSGPHYFAAPGPGAETVRVRRAKRNWRATELAQRPWDEERIEVSAD